MKKEFYFSIKRNVGDSKVDYILLDNMLEGEIWLFKKDNKGRYYKGGYNIQKAKYEEIRYYKVYNEEGEIIGFEKEYKV